MAASIHLSLIRTLFSSSHFKHLSLFANSHGRRDCTPASIVNKCSISYTPKSNQTTMSNMHHCSDPMHYSIMLPQLISSQHITHQIVYHPIPLHQQHTPLINFLTSLLLRLIPSTPAPHPFSLLLNPRPLLLLLWSRNLHQLIIRNTSHGKCFGCP